MESGEPLRIGEGSLGDGYGVAVSPFPATEGRIYVPDAQSNTVKIYDPTTSKTTPVAEIKDPFGKPFISLKDSAIAIDKVTGEVYFADDQQPLLTERPQATIYVYSSNNLYKGHLKYNVITSRPPGLAIDNSNHAEGKEPPVPTQGRVYVTSGNTTPASIYAYGPGSATTTTVPLPPIGSGLQPPGSSSDPGSLVASSGSTQADGGAGEVALLPPGGAGEPEQGQGKATTSAPSKAQAPRPATSLAVCSRLFGTGEDKGTHKATAEFDGQNGKVADLAPVLKNGKCPKGRKGAKRAKHRRAQRNARAAG